jgi:DNA ligase-1
MSQFLIPMKGVQVTDLSKITFPKLGSVKVDGFRCQVSDQARTSRGKLFANNHVRRKLKGLLPKGVILDGEIVVGKKRGEGVLTRTSSGVTTQEGKPDWRLWVFDAPRKAVKFEQRLQLAKTLIEDLAHPRIRFLKHVWIENLEELEKFIEWARAHGYEGVMLRDPDGPYKEGKSTLREQWLLKIKPFVDKEGRVVGYYEEMENTNEGKRDATGKLKRSSAKAGKKPKGRLGGLLLRDLETDEPVRVGGGFTGKQRVDLWAIRKRISPATPTSKPFGPRPTSTRQRCRLPKSANAKRRVELDYRFVVLLICRRDARGE